MSSDPKKSDDMGVFYIFGCYDKIAGWQFPPFKFRLINTNPKKVTGQFLTSNWFNRIYNVGEVQHYMVIGINKPLSYALITAINDSLPSQVLYYALTRKEMDLGVVFKDRYILNSTMSEALLQGKAFNESHEVITINGEKWVVFSANIGKRCGK